MNIFLTTKSYYYFIGDYITYDRKHQEYTF